jgi:hypothetical protein
LNKGEPFKIPFLSKLQTLAFNYGFLLCIGFIWLHMSRVISSNFLFLEANSSQLSVSGLFSYLYETLEKENVGQIIESSISLLTVVEVTPYNKINRINYI